MVPFSRAELQGVQNAAARLITGTRKFDHVTPILRELHWLPVAQQIQYKIAMLVNKMSAGPMAPPYLAEDWWPVVHLIQDVDTWGRPPPANSTCNGQATAIGRRNFAVSGPETWSSLPAELRLSTLSTTTFTRLLKWKRISSSALNDMCLQRVWFYLRLHCFLNIMIIISIIIILTQILRARHYSTFNISNIDNTILCVTKD